MFIHAKPINRHIILWNVWKVIISRPICSCTSGFDLYGVERSENSTASFSELKSYDSVDELIADPEIELVIINTPNYTHFEFAQKHFAPVNMFW
ncbi:hypothetical protein CS542_05280 [Pedobacter sp. IW39]|nr:hypothetical protein CS542_05280 [Pedobacter sp. IW39]